MKSFIYVLLFIIIHTCVFTNSAVAQVSEDANIWSVVKLGPNNAGKVESDKPWIHADKISKFYNLGIGITVDPNFRPHPSSVSTQSEISVDIHPSNSNIIFGSANATDWPVTGVNGTGVYWSLDGASTWTGYDNPSPLFGSNSGDPVSVIGTDGRFYENFISNPGGQGVAVSTNNGTTWNSYTVAPNPGSLADKNHYMVDKQSGSPYENRSYCAWTDFGGSNDYDVVFKYSSNFGVSWSGAINLSSSLSSYLDQGVNIQTGPSGEVYATWAVYHGFGVSSGEDGIGFAKSTDGGVTWSSPAYAYQQTDFGIRGNLSSKSGIRVSSFPSMSVDRSGGINNGTIYITWPQRNVSPAGSDPDIVLVKSVDGGITWSSPIRVNDDPLNNGKDQYFPWSTVDQSTGQLMLIFYDGRNVTNSQTEVYMARSNDGGATFENFVVSDQPHSPAPISGLASGYAGDYIGVTALNDIAYPFWGDNRTGNYQGWMTKVTFGPPCPIDAATNPTPTDGVSNIPVSTSQISWTNGSGAAQCEVWFGESGNMAMLYDGALISSWLISGGLNYNTNYNWQIISKNDTCNVTSPVWSFNTEFSPAIMFMETFEDLSCWTPIGPLGTSNWSTQSTTNAGGTAPELRLSWSPSFDGLSKLVSCTIPVENSHNYSVTLKHMMDWYANPAPNFGIGVSYDNGVTYTSIWDFQPSGNIDPETISASFTTPAAVIPNATNLNLVLYCNGNSFNIDYWYMDDITLTDDEFSIVTDPTFFAATAVSNTSILLGFTTNANNNNVITAWNLTGIFTAPSGTPPAPGQPFAGGTLLSNGTSSPVNHNGLNELTTYYYKAFSYDNANYSTGLESSATTLEPPSVTDFSVDFLVSDNCANSISLTFGTAPGATECYDDGLDQWAPPPPPSGVFDGRFLTCNEGLFVDYKATNPDSTRIWDVMYQPTTGCESVSFNWDPAQLPVDGNFHLVDPFTGNMFNVDMRTNSSYTDLLGLGHLQIVYNYEIPDFTANFLIYDNCSNSIQLTFGTSLSATECYDSGLDQWAPPPPPSGVFDGRFIACNDGLFIDYKATNPDSTRIWDVMYQPTIGCEPVSFSWNPAQLPADGNFNLVDPFTGNMVNVDMRTSNNYTDVLGLGQLQIIYSFGPATFSLSVSVLDGWNMVSIPGLHPADQDVLTWWSGKDPAAAVFGFNGSYSAVTTAAPGEGYWMKHLGANLYDTGDEWPAINIVTHDLIPANAGWNLIGGYENVATTSLITTNPPGLVDGPVFGFSSGYSVATTLEPGFAYWIKLTAAGDIIIPSSLLSKSGAEPVEYFKEEWGRITITDNAGRSFILYAVTDDANLPAGQAGLDNYEMPPAPPQGSFDIRFSSNRIAEDINTTSQTIQMSSGVEYPIVVKVENMDIRIQDESGRLLNEVIESGQQLTISSRLDKLVVTGELVPEVYALEQNYPNPFNPSTVIEFSLPENVSNVRLTIYNALGKRVAELVNTTLEAGKYSYQWDATNVATGMYIYELRTEKFVSVKKMLMIK